MATAAAAERAGFRPCLRCRPELAPCSPATSIEEALYAGIRSRALHGDSVEKLAVCTGFSTRQLRRLMVKAFGVTPVEIAQTERLLFAKKLLQETALPATKVALSAGFGSVRRFNALFRSRYSIAPMDLRREVPRVRDHQGNAIHLRIAFRPPLAWKELLAYLARRAVPGVEYVDPHYRYYARTLDLDHGAAWLQVRNSEAGAWLDVTLPESLAPAAWPILARLRALFDLDANPANIDAHLGTDDLLASSVRKHPGLRVPGSWSTFELAVRAVLGQQVSVAGATTLARRLVERFGRAIDTPWGYLHRLSPSHRDLSGASVDEIAAIGLPKARAATLRELAIAAETGALDFPPTNTFEDVIEQLCAIRGVGRWTAQYIAMRALRYPDAFPATDLGIHKALGSKSPSPPHLINKY